MPRRQWAVANSGTPVTLAANNVARVNMTALIEADMDRTMGNYTVMRMVGSLTIKGTGINVITPYAAGVIQSGSNVNLASIADPEIDNSADWIWHRRGYVDAVALPMLVQDIDNRSMRKTPQLDRIWWFMITNSVGGADFDFGVYLRVLLQFPD